MDVAYDVIIAGSGPAGGSAAYFLSTGGMRVLVLEKEHLPRYKTCGGGISPQFLQSQFPFSFEPILNTEVYLEKEDYERIAAHIGEKRLRSLCRYDKTLRAWVLRQPCPFFDPQRGCEIYQIRPLTCTKYPLHPPSPDMPYHLAADAFCPGVREFAKKTLGWWIICENHWAELLGRLETNQAKDQVKKGR